MENSQLHAIIVRNSQESYRNRTAIRLVEWIRDSSLSMVGKVTSKKNIKNKTIIASENS